MLSSWSETTRNFTQIYRWSTPANIGILGEICPRFLALGTTTCKGLVSISHHNVREIILGRIRARRQKSHVGYWIDLNPYDRTPVSNASFIQTRRPGLAGIHDILSSSATSISSTSPSKSNDSITVPELSSTQAILRPILPLTATEKFGPFPCWMIRCFPIGYKEELSFDAWC